MERSAAERDRIHASAFVLGTIVCGVISLSVVLPGLLRGGGAVRIDLDERVNPNTASVGSMIRLPGIGFVRAAAIVHHRRQAQAENPAAVTFANPADLEQVRGLGPKTVEGISRWLRFREEQGSVGFSQ